MKSCSVCLWAVILFCLLGEGEPGRCSWGSYKDTSRATGVSYARRNSTHPHPTNNLLKDCKEFCDQASGCHGFSYAKGTDNECVFEYSSGPGLGYRGDHDYYICLDPQTHTMCKGDPGCDFVYPCYDRKKSGEKRCHYVKGEMKMCVLSEKPFPWLT